MILVCKQVSNVLQQVSNSDNFHNSHGNIISSIKKEELFNQEYHIHFLVEVHLQATGDAPIMKQKKYKVDGEKRIDWIIAFIRKFLKLEPTDSLVSESNS